jgi:hypothetical protein
VRRGRLCRFLPVSVVCPVPHSSHGLLACAGCRPARAEGGPGRCCSHDAGSCAGSAAACRAALRRRHGQACGCHRQVSTHATWQPPNALALP